jgi:rhodanese-related sulfurtransferase
MVVALLVAVPALAQQSTPSPRAKDAKEMSVDELKKKIDSGAKVLVIDVREDEEVKTGSIPGAVQVRMSELESRMKDIPKNVQLVFT